MNLDRAFVLLFASIRTIAGFTPSVGRSLYYATSSRSSSSSSNVAFAPRVNALLSEVEQSSAEVTTATAVASSFSSSGSSSSSSSEEEESPVVDKSEFNTAIYVGNISFDTNESDIMSAFAAHGIVSKVQVPTDRNTGRARGFAFVTMSNAAEHAAAIAALNESEMGGRTIYVSESLPKDKVAEKKKRDVVKKPRGPMGTKIYVGNLNFDTTVEEVQEAFAPYGNVQDCFVPMDYDGNPRGFAFVSMEEENALSAIDGLDGTELGGRTLIVKKSLPKGEKSPTSKVVKLYVGNLSWGTEESALRELFEEYGKVVDCYLPVDKETGQHRGFAFVTMDPNDAVRAADETDGYELDGRILRVNEAQAKGSGRQYNNYNDGYDSGGGGYDADDNWGSNNY